MQFDVGMGDYFDEEEEEFLSDQDYIYEQEPEDAEEAEKRETLKFDRDIYTKDEIKRMKAEIQEQRRQDRYDRISTFWLNTRLANVATPNLATFLRLIRSLQWYNNEFSIKLVQLYNFIINYNEIMNKLLYILTDEISDILPGSLTVQKFALHEKKKTISCAAKIVKLELKNEEKCETSKGIFFK